MNPENVNPEPERAIVLSPRRLWFGFTGGAIAWILAGLLNVLLAWQACMGGEAGSLFIFTQTGIRVLQGCITFVLLGVAIFAAVVAYKNWRQIAELDHTEPVNLMAAEARDRQAFMGYFGLIVNATLGVGIMWFSMAVFIIRMCVRAH